MLVPLLIFQVITFIGLIFILKFIFTRQVNAALDRLNALHEQNLIKEAQLTEELKRAEEERKSEVERGKQEAAALIEETKKDLIRMRIRTEEEAKVQAEKIINHGKDEVGRLKEKLVKEIQNQSADLAVKMIGETFTDKGKEDLQHKFISEIIEEVAKIPAEKFSVSTDKVRVISSYPLQEEQKKNLKKVLDEKLTSNTKLEEIVNKELISGLLLEIGGLVIDGSLKNRLRRVVELSNK